MREALGRFANGVGFVDGVDAAQLRVLVNKSSNANGSDSETRLQWTSQQSAFTNFVATDFFPSPVNRGPTRGLEALGQASNDLKERSGSPVQHGAVIVFITHRIEAANTNAEADASAWAGLLREAHIPVYAFQTDRTERNKRPLLNLAGSARYATLEAPFQSKVDALYGDIAAHRQYYSVTYTSKLGDAKPRVVTWSDPTGRGVAFCRGEGHDTYTFAGVNPEIDFVDLPNTLAFSSSNSEQRIRVRLRWPAGVTPRRMAKAELLVDDISKADGEFSSDGQSIEFLVNARDFGSNSSAALKVLLTDRVGQQIRSQDREVGVEQAQPVITATPFVAPPEPPDNPLLTVAATIGVLALLGGAVGGGYFLWRRRQAAPRSGGWVTNTQQLSSHLTATLTVVEGPHGLKDRKFKLSKNSYVLGREGADIEFYRDAEISTVSRKHCTISRDRDLSFWVTDTKSSNGTHIIRGGNKQPLVPFVRSALHNGDQILLGDLQRNGVLLHFTLDNPTQQFQRNKA
jgi:hypothetical protein